MKLTENEALVVNVLMGVFCGVFAAYLELDPIRYFFFGVAMMYLNWQIQGRIWTWWRKTPPFMGWKYWIEQVKQK